MVFHYGFCKSYRLVLSCPNQKLFGTKIKQKVLWGERPDGVAVPIWSFTSFAIGVPCVELDWNLFAL